MTDDTWQVIGRLRRAQPRNPDTMAMCTALEQALHRIRELERILVSGRAPPKEGGFDRNAYMREYMREYMRRRRAKAKKAK